MSAFCDNVLLFGRVLRAAGIEVHHSRLLDAIRALELTGVRRRSDVASTLRCLLLHDRDDIARFDQAFDLFFRAHRRPSPGPPLFSLGERPRVVVTPSGAGPVGVELEALHAESDASTRTVGAWSATGVSRTKDFADFTAADLERARILLERLPWRLSVRRTRRWTSAVSGHPDLRPLLRRNLTRGDLVDLPQRRRRRAARPLVVLGDVSGSMERYTRILLHFIAGLARSETRVEAFLFATRLTRVTRRLAGRRGTHAFAQLARDVQDWGGGTRIGEALRAFNTTWARRVMRNGPVVIIISDGWDRGAPEVLGREAARLRRSCRRLIWLNPLLGSPGYEPLTRGLQAALRHVDDFLPAHNLDSLDQLVEHLSALPARSRPVGLGVSAVGWR